MTDHDSSPRIYNINRFINTVIGTNDSINIVCSDYSIRNTLSCILNTLQLKPVPIIIEFDVYKNRIIPRQKGDMVYNKIKRQLSEKACVPVYVTCFLRDVECANHSTCMIFSDSNNAVYLDSRGSRVTQEDVQIRKRMYMIFQKIKSMFSTYPCTIKDISEIFEGNAKREEHIYCAYFNYNCTLFFGDYHGDGVIDVISSVLVLPTLTGKFFKRYGRYLKKIVTLQDAKYTCLVVSCMYTDRSFIVSK